MKFKQNPTLRRALHCAVLAAAVFAFSGASDPSTRFNELGHQLMCICSCGQILLECNHVGCPSSDGMRNELMAAVSRGDSDSLVEQSFVQSLPGEEQWVRSRLRSLGCSPCTGAIRSDADTIPKIIAELVGFRSSERANRVIDCRTIA